MKLYYAAGACSLSPHIALRESGLPFELVKVDWMNGRTLANGEGVLADVNTKDYVPALRLDDDQVLSEGVAIVQYIADRAPDTKLAPANGTLARVRLQEWLNFISTELHKGLGPFFGKSWATAEVKAAAFETLTKRLAHIERTLADGRTWLTGEDFTVADGYLVYALRSWQLFAKGELTPNLAAYWNRLLERPSVKAALEAEGLVTKKAA
ncbi:MAG: glutathione transferase GstA [Deltaproteobacteria bacterium]|nr:glutathione transferase GstA [Deltaproteobacteria bacterium]